MRCAKKIESYSVFSGLPYLASMLDGDKTLEENIENLLIPQTGKARIYIEYVLKMELSKVQYGSTILSILGNAKMRYSEIENAIGKDISGRLAQQLNALLELEIIEKIAPINKKMIKRKYFIRYRII